MDNGFHRSPIQVADEGEEIKAGPDAEREFWEITEEAGRRFGRFGGGAGDDEGETAGWAVSGDTREAMGAAATRIDSRGPTSLSDDVFVIPDDSEDSVVYAGRYVVLCRACAGWVAVVFCTAVLGYDKGVVIK